MAALVELEVVPLGIIGAEVEGVHLAHATRAQIDAIKHAWYRHDVLLRLLDEIWCFVETALYRHQWAPGDLVLWDNRTTMHRRDAFDSKARRVMHRTQIRGSAAPRRASTPLATARSG